MAFNDWYGCEIIDLDSGAIIALDAEYTGLALTLTLALVRSIQPSASNPNPSSNPSAEYTALGLEPSP